jgi:hypothetical protein
MVDEYKDCSSMEKLTAAMKRGDEIEMRHSGKDWEPWHRASWQVDVGYRCRSVKPVRWWNKHPFDALWRHEPGEHV